MRIFNFNISANVDQGVVYLFTFAGHLLYSFTASDGQAYDLFGDAVASYGKTVVIGAPGGSAVYVFDLNSKDELHKLMATNGTIDDYFGIGVAIFGNIIMVSAPKNGYGSVYTFDASNGTQLLKFTNTDTPKSLNLGYGSSGMATHAGKNVGIVGHMYEDRGNTLHDAGAVYVFDLHTGLQIRKVTPAQSASGMRFGCSVLVFGDYLLVGAPCADQKADSMKGRVYVFDINANWAEITSFGPSDDDANGRFGRCMAMSGQNFIVTAYTRSNDERGMENGAVYVGEMTAGLNCSKLIHILSVLCRKGTNSLF